MKIMTVVGARPQFIKVAAVSRVLRGVGHVREVIVHTGQHYDANMSDVFFNELDLPAPDYRLAIGSGGHGAQTGRMLELIEPVIMEESPDLVLVYGDTNSTLAGALAAAKLHVPVAHVEAGLRSFNRRMPEEINRIITDHLSDILFTPTQAAVNNLRHEGIESERVHAVGDVMYDAALYFGDKAERESRAFSQLNLSKGGYILATIHRAENTDDPHRLEAIFSGLAQVAKWIPIIMPLHPRTRAALKRVQTPSNYLSAIRTIDPVGYLDMVMLEKGARLVVTDSGGVQKEAFFHRVPCITLRHETEWVELVELGWNRLAAPMSAEAIVNEVLGALESEPGAKPPVGLYGGGTAANRIVKKLLEGFGVVHTASEETIL